MYRYRIERRIGAQEDLGTFEGLGPVDALARMLRGKGVPALAIGGDLHFVDPRDATMNAAHFFEVRMQGHGAKEGQGGALDFIFRVGLDVGRLTAAEGNFWQAEPVDDRIWPQGVGEDGIEGWLVVAVDQGEARDLVRLHLGGHRVTLKHGPSLLSGVPYAVGRGRAGAPLRARAGVPIPTGDPPKRGRPRFVLKAGPKGDE